VSKVIFGSLKKKFSAFSGAIIATSIVSSIKKVWKIE
jgi:hypothetical protein